MRRGITLILMLFVGLNSVLAQIEPTATPPPVQSIFYYDTCSPPCWLGLIPGKSSPADVEKTFRLHSDIVIPESIRISPAGRPDGLAGYDVDPDTGYMIAGGYYFATAGIDDITPDNIQNRIDIRDGVVDLMVIHPTEPSMPISLRDVLQKLGTPDIIRLYTVAKQSTVVFIYSGLSIRVNLNLASDACRTSTLLDKMLVYNMLYYSTGAASRVRKDSEYRVPQSNLTGYILKVERDVPHDLWQSWLNGQIDMTCEAAWWQLPQPEVTPAPEATIEPAATEQP